MSTLSFLNSRSVDLIVKFTITTFLLCIIKELTQTSSILEEMENGCYYLSDN